MIKRIYIGTYTDTGSPGILIFDADTDTGKLNYVGSATAPDPSYLTLSADGRHLYAALETAQVQGVPGGGAAVFEVMKDGLMPVQEVSSGRDLPCHVRTSPDGRRLVVSNYGDGTFNIYRLDERGRIAGMEQFVQHDGSGPDKTRQEGPHAHCAAFTPDGKYLLVADLGMDAVICYPYDEASGADTQAGRRIEAIVPGSGPRHIAFSPDGRLCFVVQEMGCRVDVYRYRDGEFEAVSGCSTLPEGWQGESTCAAVRVSADGRHVYASNRGHDSIAVLSVNKQGEIALERTIATGGSIPRDFALLPGEKFIVAAHQQQGGLVVMDMQGSCVQHVEAERTVCVCF